MAIDKAFVSIFLLLISYVLGLAWLGTWKSYLCWKFRSIPLTLLSIAIDLIPQFLENARFMMFDGSSCHSYFQNIIYWIALWCLHKLLVQEKRVFNLLWGFSYSHPKSVQKIIQHSVYFVRVYVQKMKGWIEQAKENEMESVWLSVCVCVLETGREKECQCQVDIPQVK